MSAPSGSTGLESFITPLDGEKVVNGEARPMGVASIAPGPMVVENPPIHIPSEEDAARMDKQQAQVRQARANLDAAGRRIIMAMNRQAPCKIKYEELGVVLNAIRAALR